MVLGIERRTDREGLNATALGVTEKAAGAFGEIAILTD